MIQSNPQNRRYCFGGLLLLLVAVAGCRTAQTDVRVKEPQAEGLHSTSDPDPAVAATHDGNDTINPKILQKAMMATVERVSTSVAASSGAAKGWIPSPNDHTVFGQNNWRELLNVYDAVRRSANVAKREANKYGIQSMGGVIDGVMVGSTMLPLDGDNYRVMRVHRKRHTNFGTESLVSLIAEVADAVAAQYPGAVMSVGNMANKYGGDLYWSRSHNTGRDVDVSFYVLSKSTGKQVYLPFFRHYDDNGVCTTNPDYIFDVPKNWALVEALLSSKKATIQRLFISEGLRKILLDYATSEGKPQWLIDRATAVLKQPATSPPHNDHLHVRIACPKNDRLFGCLELGPQYPWADWHLLELRRQAQMLAEVFDDPTSTPKDRISVLDMLDAIDSPHKIDVALLWGLKDPSPAVAKRALKLLEDGWPGGELQLELAIRWLDRVKKMRNKDLSTGDATAGDGTRGQDDGIRPNPSVPRQDYDTALYALLRKLRTRRGWDYALATLKSQDNINDKEATHAKAAAADALRHSTSRDDVVELVELMNRKSNGPHESRQPDSVLQAINETLNYITMHQVPGNIKKSGEHWKQWLEEHPGLTPEESRENGILALMKTDKLEPKDYGRLIARLKNEKAPYIIYNIARYLSDHTDFASAYEPKKTAEVYDTWSRWWRRNRQRFQ